MRERRSALRERNPDGEYVGDLGKTKREPILIVGEDGGAKVRWVYRGVNAATDSALGEMARSGELFRIDRVTDLALEFIYHDPRAKKFALVLPETLRHRYFEERASLLRRIAEEGQFEIPAYVAEARVVIGMEGLRRYLVEGRPKLRSADRFDAPISVRGFGESDGDSLRDEDIGRGWFGPEGEPPPEELTLDEDRLEDSLLKLIQEGERAIPVLERALSGPSAEVRLAGAIGLAELRATSAARSMVDAYLEETSDAAPHFARLLAYLGEEALEAIEARMRDEIGMNRRLALAMAHLAEAGFDVEIEQLAQGDDALARTAREGLRRIMDARDAVALSSLEERLQMEGSSRLAARLEARLRH